MKITQERYNKILRQLRTPEDVKPVSEREGVPESTLMSLLAHSMVRQTMRLFYSVKARSKELHGHWESGKTFTDVSRMCKIAPTLCASFILEHKGYSKKMFRSAVKNPASVQDARLRRELDQAIKEDFIYSDWAAEEQRARGEQHERNLEKWLAAKGYSFWTEKDRAGEEKTPDFLLKNASTWNGKTVHWFESKGYFGDQWEVKRSYSKQLKKYVELFGPGVVVYWLGYITDMPLPPEFGRHIFLADEEDFRS